MADIITYTDKEQGQVSTEPVNKRWNFGDANEVKTVVNSLSSDIDVNSDRLDDLEATQTGGWGFYVDSQTSPATQVFNTVASKLQIDGVGVTSNETYLPTEIRGVNSLWDNINDKIIPINLGDGYALRLDLTVNSDTGNPTYIEFELDIGGAATPTTTIVNRVIGLPKTPPFDLSISFHYFSLSTFLSNGGQLFLKTDTGTVTVGKRSLMISRSSNGDI